ncbi:MAG: trypsin-like peptidase domain-containing protein [Pirellulales bacterium]
MLAAALLGWTSSHVVVVPAAGVRASEARRSAIVEAVERVKSAVVNIHGEKTLAPGEVPVGTADGDRRVNGMGTGAIIDERGYILTNHHVVDGVSEIHVTLTDARQYTARLISHDPTTDLAIIKIDAASKLDIVPIGISSDLMTGESVIAIGNAFGYEHTVTRGIISALHRTVQVGDTQKYEDLIQTDASINPGNSGGPLFNIDGEMIGINVAVRVGAQGIGFAIPIDKALEIATDLMSSRRIANTWHGIVAAPADKTNTAAGVVVRAVDVQSPAAKGGLSAGDQIVRVEGVQIDRPIDVERAMLDHRAGEKIEVEVSRNGQEEVVELTLADLPEALRGGGGPAWELLGLKLTPLTAKQFQRYHSRYRGGLSVTSVRPDSPAAKQGIRRGDVLLGLHVWETISLENVEYVLNRPDFSELSPLKFYVLRGSELFPGYMNVGSTARPSTR